MYRVDPVQDLQPERIGQMKGFPFSWAPLDRLRGDRARRADCPACGAESGFYCVTRAGRPTYNICNARVQRERLGRLLVL